ncbi:MAG: TIGR02281 family clan AA aspartic protease [Pseudomonadota bacterium]
MIRIPSDSTLKSHRKLLFSNKIFRNFPNFAIVIALLFKAVHCEALPHIEVIALFEGKAMLRINQQQLLMSEGETNEQGIQLIKADADQALVEVKGKQLVLELGSTVYEAPTSEVDKTAKEIYIYRAPDNLFRTTGSINGFPVNFLVDTGASSIVINAQEARRLGIDYKKNGTPIMVRTASGSENAIEIKIDKVSISGVTLRSIDGIVLEGAEPSIPLLGMSYLSRFEIQNNGTIMKLLQKY